MTPEMWNALFVVGGAVLAALADRFGFKNPLKPEPPPSQPAVDAALSDAHAWLLNAKAGKVKPDDLDFAVLAQVKPLLDEVLALKK